RLQASVRPQGLRRAGARDDRARSDARERGGAARRPEAQRSRRRRSVVGREAGGRGVQELRRANAGAADVRAGLPGGAVAPRQAQARRPGARGALGALHPEARAGERLQRAERSRGAAPPLRAAGAAARRRRRGSAAAGRGLRPGARVRYAAHRRRRIGSRPAADDPRRPVAHPGCHSLSHAPARMISRFELHVALRYLRSRRTSRLLSLITVIAVGGVTVGVMALVVVLGVMNGLQADLRYKILVANPHLRVLTYGEGLKLDDWHKVLGEVRRAAGVDAAAPFVLTQGLISAGHDY